MVELNTILTFIQTTGIIVGVAYYILNIRNNQRKQEMGLKAQETTLETRQAQLFMQIFHRFYEPDFFDKYTQVLSWQWTDYNDFMSKYGWKTNPEAWYSEGSVAAYFEGIGLLVYMELLDVKLVHGLLFRHVKLFGEKINPVSVEMRKRLKLHHVDQWVEYLRLRSLFSRFTRSLM